MDNTKQKNNKTDKQSFYFSHDFNVRSDIKIKKLIVKHGFEGYGIFWALIEDLYQNANALPLDYDCIAYDLRTSSDIVKSIINDFNLFVIGEGTFSSLSVQRRLSKRNEKSSKARRSAMKRWGANANALQAKCEGNAIKERKGKEIKGNINKEYTKKNSEREFDFKKALLEYGFDKILVEEWLAIRKKKKAVNSEFAYNSFISQIGRAGAEKNEVLRIIAEKQWAGFNHIWLQNNNKNHNTFENETDRRNRESAERKQEIYEYAKSVGMVGSEKEQDIRPIW